jgi:cob(I)alamin adenosyltransferase
MGNRLSKIYTRTGDAGETGLGDGSRVSKCHALIEVIGEVDELNCHIGMLRAELHAQDSLDSILSRIQHTLFDLGGQLSVPGLQLISDQQVEELENELDRHNADLPALANFILPGGNRAAAACHLARAVCRRAERRLVALPAERDAAGRYLNRLSDLLFVLARVLVRRNGGNEVLWEQAPKPQDH